MNNLIIKYYYGDFDSPHPNPAQKRETANAQGLLGGETANNTDTPKSEPLQHGTPPPTGGGREGAWPLWEVFIRSKQGLDHKHVGSLHATDAQMAIENARDVYTRRQEGVSIWVVESKYIHASNPDESDSLYEPANDKVYRHPTFYNLPDEVNHM